MLTEWVGSCSCRAGPEVSMRELDPHQPLARPPAPPSSFPPFVQSNPSWSEAPVSAAADKEG